MPPFQDSADTQPSSRPRTRPHQACEVTLISGPRAHTSRGEPPSKHTHTRRYFAVIVNSRGGARPVGTLARTLLTIRGGERPMAGFSAAGARCALSRGGGRLAPTSAAILAGGDQDAGRGRRTLPAIPAGDRRGLERGSAFEELMLPGRDRRRSTGRSGPVGGYGLPRQSCRRSVALRRQAVRRGRCQGRSQGA